MRNANKHCYPYPRPAVAADAAIFRFVDEDLRVLLIKRKKDPHKQKWALPGGFVEMDESLVAAAARELKEETGLKDIHLHEVGSFSDPDRDPRTRVISVAFYGFAEPANNSAKAGDDAADVFWFSVRSLPPMAFDHEMIISEALERMKTDSRLKPVLFPLMPEEFRIRDLRIMYEEICGEIFDKKQFSKAMLDSKYIVPVRKKRGSPSGKKRYTVDHATLKAFFE